MPAEDLGPITVEVAIRIARESLHEALGDDPERVVRNVDAAAEGWEAFRSTRRDIDATMRAKGLSDHDVRLVDRAVYGDLNKALSRLRKAIS